MLPADLADKANNQLSPEARADMARQLRFLAARALWLAGELENPKPLPPPRLTLRDKIYRALSDAGRPMKGLLVANKVGHSYDGNFRHTIATMVRAGTLARTTHGYSVPEQRPLELGEHDD
jgi:hypothetical protein